MKRYFISAGLILVSAAYFVTQHFGGDEQKVAMMPNPDTSLPIASSTGPTPTYSQTKTTAQPSKAGSTGGSDSKTSNSGISGSGTTGTTGTTVKGQYRDGSYTGTASDAFYGYVQVRAVVSGGKLAAVQILQYPNDRNTSRYINSQALPYLEQEAVTAQSADVNTISGASDTSQAFRESLSSALSQAKA